MQLARVRLAWRRYFIVSSAMPLGITVLLRIRGPAPEPQALQFVAGAVVLAVALSALTFLAQRVAWMKANRVFDYYNTLPTSSVLLLLAIFVSYFAFAVPGIVAISLVGSLIFGLHPTLTIDLLWVLPTLLLGGIALAGIGALIGLAGRDEQLAGTYANLAMMAVLFLGIVPASDFQAGVRIALNVIPSTYMVDSLKLTLAGTVRPIQLTVDLLAVALFAAAMMFWSARVLRTRSH
jgi:ABC-2 type transport system permease protein